MFQVIINFINYASFTLQSPIIYELWNIFLIDYCYLFYHCVFKIEFTNTARWFLLHSIVNMIVVYYAVDDVKLCIQNSGECYKMPWNENSIKVYNYAFLLHIYHCVFFKLTKDDIVHHTLMVGICGTLCYLLQSILSSLALFFLSGLPGGIDYFLLYLVKKNRLKSIVEKNMYTILSAYFRSPGCILTTFIGLNGVTDYYNNGRYYKLILLISTLSLIFWNGQYYLLKSHESYIRKSI
jgi:hypothetical protein